MKDHYKTLGIDKTADAQQIKRAYFVMVKKYPPERFPEEFKEIRAAYDALSDEKKRSEYDASAALPEDAAHLFHQAQKAGQQGKHEQAANIYQDILKRYPALSDIRAEYARSLEAQGKTGKAIKVWESLCASEPDSAGYATALADCYDMRGWRKKAISAYWRAIAIDDGIPECWESLIECHTYAAEFNEVSSVCLQAVEATRKSGKESVYIYSHAAFFGAKGKSALTEEYLQDIVRLSRESIVGQKNAQEAIPFLLLTLEMTNQMRFFPYIREISETLPYVEEHLIEPLSRAERGFEIESLEENGFSDLLHDLFEALNANCDREDYTLDIMAMEFHILSDSHTYRPQLIRLKEEYPQLYALHAAFFNEALRVRDPQKMMYQRYKKLSKHGAQPTPKEDFPPVQQPTRREGAKIGRNDPCPCGSGKKFKKCCGA